MRVKILALGLICFFIFACGGKPESGWNGGVEPEASKVIGSAGGTVEVTNSSSPLYGIKVEVPPAALNTDSTISIETTTVSPLYNADSRA